jgi:tetratricopeptide (TPR) repeat protein
MEILKSSVKGLFIFATSFTFAQANLQKSFNESYAHEYEKKYESAIASINEVKSENCYECYYRLGWLHYAAGKTTEAIANYWIASKIMPAATEPLWGLVTIYAKIEKWVELEKTYLAILKIDTKNTTANYRLGLIYYYRKDYVNAKKYFDISLNLYPTDTESLLMTAWTNYFLGNIPAAKSLFNKVILLQPTIVSAAEGLKLVK